MFDEDVKIYFDHDLDPKKHLHINSGTCYVHDRPSSCTKYLYQGYLPRQDWRLLNSAEKNKLLSQTELRSRHNTIALGKIPKSILQFSRTIGIHELVEQDQAINFTKEKNYEYFKRKMFDFFYDYIEDPKGLCMLKLACQYTSLEVSTYNYHTKRLLGLHFDSWDDKVCEERNLSRNRMCINLGKEARSFLFVNLTLESIIKKAQINLKTLRENNDILRLFFTLFPDYQIVKLTINPGEYYIAPTENILHDGCTYKKLYPDIFLTILGYFRIYAKAENTMNPV